MNTDAAATDVSHDHFPESFACDPLVFESVKRLIKKHEINTVVETGTHKGVTTLAFAALAPSVVTIEIEAKHHSAVQLLFAERPAIRSLLGSSPLIMDEVIPSLKPPLFFYLDAHWYKYWPLLDELRIISKHSLRPVIAIHDFKVPGHPELGFDKYNGKACDWSYIGAEITGIFGSEGFDYHFNTKALGAKRGIVFIEPKDHPTA